MKFGKIFRATVEQRMPQWRDHVVNYKAIKQAIKKQMAQGTHGSQPEEVAAAFTALIDQHVETVNNFYMERIEEGVIILHALNQHCEQIRGGGMRPELRTQCQRSLVAIHFQLLLLQNYVALNFTAVTKILKKFEKRFEIPIRNDYIGALVELPFYRCDALGDLVEETERQFNALAALGATPAAGRSWRPARCGCEASPSVRPSMTCCASSLGFRWCPEAWCSASATGAPPAIAT